MIEPEPRPATPSPVLPPAPLLRGRNFGLVTEQHDSEEARLFERAASALGARVAWISPRVAGLLGNEDVAHTARWLGRLYDGIECQGLPAERVARIRGCAGIPVFDDMTAACRAELDAESPVQALQARLIGLFR